MFFKKKEVVTEQDKELFRMWGIGLKLAEKVKTLTADLLARAILCDEEYFEEARHALVKHVAKYDSYVDSIVKYRLDNEGLFGYTEVFRNSVFKAGDEVIKESLESMVDRISK